MSFEGWEALTRYTRGKDLIWRVTFSGGVSMFRILARQNGL